MIALRRLVVCAVGALALCAAVGLRAQTAPAAPTGLTYQVSGDTVWLNWINSPGAVSFYRLEAGGSPGTTFFTWDSSHLADPNRLPQLLAQFATSGVGPGVYYVRVKAVNGAGVSAPSNEVAVPVTAGCQAPGAPTDLAAITRDLSVIGRGATALLAWNAGNGGRPSTYTLHASLTPGGPPVVAFVTPFAYLNVYDVPAGTYYVRVHANTPCGTSGASPEVVVTAPSESPARLPNADTGRLPWFAVSDFVNLVGAEAQALGYMHHSRSCPSRPGFSDSDIEARKTQRNAYIDHMVSRLRLLDQRFGYNAKPTRNPAIVAGDEIAYHWGSDDPEGSPNVYLIDTLGGHCTFGNETVTFRPFFDEYGKWTAAGAF